ncbi:MAG: carboxypeptidase regulatory-like domain-containing protein [Anaerolineales bacterium]|nr:carboxypeptidase regulatory-like domain-containing protein [Anaerolineales bacterium]
MIKKTLFFTLALFLALAACGPSPEEIATMTASAWTATPTITPSPTPTPIPYDMTVKVTDADGIPIAEASVTVGDGDPNLTDANGATSWINLDPPDGSVNVSAQGYFASEQTFSLNRGPNEVVVALERDPFGLLPSQACAPGETLLYLEDFQDGEAEGWPDIDFRANGWNLEEYTDEPGNTVVSNNLMEHLGANLQDQTFAEAVWRVRFLVQGRRAISLNWLQNNGVEVDSQFVDDARYQIVVDKGNTEIRRLTIPVLNIPVGRGRGAATGVWHNIEISTFQGETLIYLDGARVSGYRDPKPLPGGGIGLELIPFDNAIEGTVNYFDNISVCGLSAPFTSMFVAP